MIHGISQIRQKKRESKLRVESDLSNSLDTREHTKQTKCANKTDEDCKDHDLGTMDTDHHKNLNNLRRGDQGIRIRTLKCIIIIDFLEITRIVF